MQAAKSDEPAVQGGGKQDGYFIRTYILSQAVPNSPISSLRAQYIQRILSAAEAEAMQEQSELRKTEPQEEDRQPY